MRISRAIPICYEIHVHWQPVLFIRGVAGGHLPVTFTTFTLRAHSDGLWGISTCMLVSTSGDGPIGVPGPGALPRTSETCWCLLSYVPLGA